MKTRVRMIPTLFVVAILGAGAYIILPSLNQTLDRDDGGVSLLVEFDPPRRSGEAPPGRMFKDQVNVQLLLRLNDPRPPEHVTASPWEQTLYPKKGTKIELRADQLYGNWIYCMIRQHGHSSVEMRRNGTVAVRCVYVVV